MGIEEGAGGVSAHEDVTKAASGLVSNVVDSFKTRPDLLLVLLFIAGVIAMDYYSGREIEERHQLVMTNLIEHCMGPAKR